MRDSGKSLSRFLHPSSHRVLKEASDRTMTHGGSDLTPSYLILNQCLASALH